MDTIEKEGPATVAGNSSSGSLQESDTQMSRTAPLEEFYQTEKSYCNCLEYVLEAYAKPLLERCVVLPMQHRVVFNGVEELRSVSECFLNDLHREIFADFDPTRAVAAVFCRWASSPELREAFTGFINGYSHYNDMLVALKDNTEFVKFCEETCAQDPRKLRLQDYLLMPVQRAPRYILLVKELLKRTSAESPDHEGLAGALAGFESLASYIDTKKKEADDCHHVSLLNHQIAKTFVSNRANNPHYTLVSPGRRFVRQISVVVKESSGAMDVASQPRLRALSSLLNVGRDTMGKIMVEDKQKRSSVVESARDRRDRELVIFNDLLVCLSRKKLALQKHVKYQLEWKKPLAAMRVEKKDTWKEEPADRDDLEKVENMIESVSASLQAAKDNQQRFRRTGDEGDIATNESHMSKLTKQLAFLEDARYLLRKMWLLEMEGRKDSAVQIFFDTEQERDEVYATIVDLQDHLNTDVDVLFGNEEGTAKMAVETRAHGYMSVHIIEAEDVLPCDSNGSSDPYCATFVDDVQCFKTKIKKHTLNPKWHEHYARYVSGTRLSFRVWDWDTVGKPDLCGNVHIPLGAIPPYCTNDVWLDLEPQGRLHVTLQFQRTDQEMLGPAALNEDNAFRVWRELKPKSSLQLVPPKLCELLWTDRKTGNKRDIDIWRPICYVNEYAVCHFAFGRGSSNPPMPTKDDGCLLVRLEQGQTADGNGDILAPPVGFQRIWRDVGSSASRDVIVFRAIPPEGYVALGDFALSAGQGRLEDPSGVYHMNEVRCVRADLVDEATTAQLWSDETCKTKCKDPASFWRVLPTNIDQQGIAAFICSQSRDSDGFGMRPVCMLKSL